MVRVAYFLFGSAARGDADSASDTDVLIVYDGEPSPSDRQKAKESVAGQLRQDCAFAEYTWERLAGMFADGNLFAWHLYYEAKPLCVSMFDDHRVSFHKPAPYRCFRLDALNFLDLLESCVHAVEGHTVSLVYEAGLGYVAIRNIGMSVSVSALSRPEFDRQVPFKVARALNIPPPCDLGVYHLMVAARHSSQRGLVAPSLDVNTLLCALKSACDWAQRALETTHDITAR